MDIYLTKTPQIKLFKIPYCSGCSMGRYLYPKTFTYKTKIDFNEAFDLLEKYLPTEIVMIIKEYFMIQEISIYQIEHSERGDVYSHCGHDRHLGIKNPKIRYQTFYCFHLDDKSLNNKSLGYYEDNINDIALLIKLYNKNQTPPDIEIVKNIYNCVKNKFPEGFLSQEEFYKNCRKSSYDTSIHKIIDKLPENNQ